MPATVVRASYTFRDAKGATARVSLYINQGGGASVPAVSAQIAAALAGLTNAHVTDPMAAPGVVVYGGTGTYQDIEDKAVISLADGFGKLHRYQVPAPLASLFLADGETVDSANAALATLLAVFAGGNIVDRGGTQVAQFVGGVRQRRRVHRKINIFTKNPLLTGPAE